MAGAASNSESGNFLYPDSGSPILLNFQLPIGFLFSSNGIKNSNPLRLRFAITSLVIVIKSTSPFLNLNAAIYLQAHVQLY